MIYQINQKYYCPKYLRSGEVADGLFSIFISSSVLFTEFLDDNVDTSYEFRHGGFFLMYQHMYSIAPAINTTIINITTMMISDFCVDDP